MKSEDPVSPEHTSTSQPVPKRRRTTLHVVAVAILVASTITLALLFTGFFNSEGVEITTSKLRSGDGLLSNYRSVAVDASLLYHGWSKTVTVWAEITYQPTQVSFSKAQSVHMDLKESIDVTIEFTLDSDNYPGDFTYRVWLTYPTLQD